MRCGAMMRRSSLRQRLMWAALAAALAALAAGAVLISLRVWPYVSTRTLRVELEEEVREVEQGLHRRADGRVAVDLDKRTDDTYDAMPADTAYLVTDAAGREVVRSIDGPALQALRVMPADASTMTVASQTRPVRLQVAERAIVRDGQRYVIRVARSDRLVLTLKEYTGKRYLRAAIVTALLILLFFLAVVFAMISRMLRPLRRASEVAARIGPRNLSARLRTDGLPTELLPLIEALNAALARLEQGYRVQQEFLASAAHELKTPLALLQAEIELGGASHPELLLRDTALMARQVHQLLHLAEVSEGHNYAFAPLSLSAAAADAIEYLARLADQHAVHLELRQQDGRDVQVEADGGALFVLFKNLLENALHHAPDGSVVLLELGPRSFSVQDEGRGVAKADRALLFQRFWRGAHKQGSGAGLGLAICREICLAHGWQIHLDASEGRSGARFVVEIPHKETR
jgi:signal transduction histidine kinase